MAAAPGPLPRDAWRSASSFADLVGLARRFLAGEPIGFPGWMAAETDEETDALLPALQAACECGFLPVASQPGAPFGPGHDGLSWVGRAFIGGFQATHHVDGLAKRADEAGLWLLGSHGCGGHDSHDAERDRAPLPAGLRDGTPYLLLGADAGDAELEIFREAVSPQAVEDLAETTFLWIVDPVWGRRDRIRDAF